MEAVKEYILGINPLYICIAKYLFMILTMVLGTIWLLSLYRSEEVRKTSKDIGDRALQQAVNSMKSSKFRMFNYDELKLYMSRSGVDFMTNEKLTPLGYVGLKLLLSLFLLIVCIQQGSVFGGLFLGIACFFIIDLIINMSDKSDNDKMLDDIKNIYDTLRIQTKAGVYITSVLTDCYLVVQNRRLKKALLDLTSDIIAKNDIEYSLDKFKDKFNNEYIDTMVIIIRQSLKTGQAVKMFDDIKVQIDDIDAAMIIAEQNRIKSQIIFVQLLLYLSIIALAIFVAVLGVQDGLAF